MSDKPHIYFISDLHLGMFPPERSLQREKLIVQWLDEIGKDASELWMLGDIFDFWFEYRKVVPRGFTRFLGKLASLSDQGVKIHLITGNHDIWTFDYLITEIGLEIHRNSMIKTWNNHLFLLGHGDGLNKGDINYRMLQSVFKNRMVQWIYARVHPNGSTTFAQWWSKKSRSKHGAMEEFLGVENEHQILFARQEIEENPEIEYLIFGHRHIPFDIQIAQKSRVICLGDWIDNFTYGVFDGSEFQLKKYLPDQGSIIKQ